VFTLFKVKFSAAASSRSCRPL